MKMVDLKNEKVVDYFEMMIIYMLNGTSGRR
jgi:hypothetical protein